MFGPVPRSPPLRTLPGEGLWAVAMPPWTNMVGEVRWQKMWAAASPVHSL